MRRHFEAHQSTQTWRVLAGQKTTCNDQCIASLTQVLRTLLQRINARFSSMDINPLELLRMYVLFND
jgi:trehalose-6-phosphate synthase